MAEPRNILVAINGTHGGKLGSRLNPWRKSDKEYDADFAGSHVRRFYEECRWGPSQAHYVRGPSTLADDVNRCFGEALSAIEEQLGDAGTKRGPARLHFAGFSRGGAIALDLANGLSRPPLGLAKVVGRTLSFGKTVDVVRRIERARARLAQQGGVVASLAMFDAVDMSSDIDGEPVGARVGRACLVRRSAGWGSRKGWTNVGDTAEPGGRPGRLRRTVLDATHGALGGQPCEGDVPQELARLLLALRGVDWALAEARFSGRPLENAAVKARSKDKGLFVHPIHGGFLNGVAAEVERIARLSDRKRPPPAAGALRSLLAAYARGEGDGMKGLGNMARDDALGGFPGIGAFFVDSRPAGDLIERFRLLDRDAARKAMRWMCEQLADDCPIKT